LSLFHLPIAYAAELVKPKPNIQDPNALAVGSVEGDVSFVVLTEDMQLRCIDGSTAELKWAQQFP
jgi:hypothetical protein